MSSVTAISQPPLAAKAIRKAKATIAEHGADQVALLIQGKLGVGNDVVEAGLVAQVKAPKVEGGK